MAHHLNSDLSREELYELVWSLPVQRAAAQLGVSGVALAKACRRQQVPLPPRGYWAHKAEGQAVLPPLPDYVPSPPAPKRLSAQAPSEIQKAIDAAYAKYRTLNEGKNADYIPALAEVDPNLFGIALVTADGKVYTAGDVKTEVSIQSISKVFTMAQVIQEQGLDSIEKQIGVDATGMRFNSIVAVEAVHGVVGAGAPEMNALVNPGAISATSMVRGGSADEVWKRIIGFHNDSAGRALTVLQDVYKSERDSNQRNQAIGASMLAYGYIKTDWSRAVDLYTRQCSIGVNAGDLAMMAATLAFGGKNPGSGKQVLDNEKVPGVLAVMATAGLYDDSGKWLYHTGLPANSGVGTEATCPATNLTGTTAEKC